jgi:hypothetical protein
MARSHYREPTVTRGPDQALPEKRPNVIEKIKARLVEKPKGFRFDFSNGEFISSSLCIASTFEDCKAVRTLDTSSYTVHFDPTLKVFWRHGGCFD